MSRVESESYWAGLESESSRFRVRVQVFVIFNTIINEIFVMRLLKSKRRKNALQLITSSVSTVRRSLTVDTTHALVRALVHSLLDYCNSVLAGQPKYCFNKLQSVLLLDLYNVCQAGRMSVRSSVDNCTGCHSRKECSSSCALMSTSASINWHQCNWVNCVCLFPRTPADLIYVRLPLVTYLFLRLEQKQLVRVDFSHLVHPHGTSCLLT